MTNNPYMHSPDRPEPEPPAVDHNWRLHAACRDLPGLFEAADIRNSFEVHDAKDICAACPEWVRHSCLEAAMASEGLPRQDRYSVRGGLDQAEREQLGRERMAGDE